MWFVFPSPPYIVNGVESGSDMNRRYALRSDEEVRAYLNFKDDGVNLRGNYAEAVAALRDQLSLGKMPFGCVDEPKLKSSLRLFERASREEADDALHAAIKEVIGLLRARQARERVASAPFHIS